MKYDSIAVLFVHVNSLYYYISVIVDICPLIFSVVSCIVPRVILFEIVLYVNSEGTSYLLWNKKYQISELLN